MSTYFDAAQKLYTYLLNHHWQSGQLSGPDIGIRFNSRILRFIKSYLAFIPWKDNYYYIQGQAYWVMCNWVMFKKTGDNRYRDVAVEATDTILKSQLDNGAWVYPNPEWAGRYATVEGCFGAIAMLKTYGHTQNEDLLTASRRWYDFMVTEVGFQEEDSMLAVNYFSNVSKAKVPNNTTLALQMIGVFMEVTGDQHYMEYAAPMVKWLNHVQLPSGELPYSVTSEQGQGRTHLFCYQYNAFEFMDIVDYYQATNDEAIVPVIRLMTDYLAGGITQNGTALFECDRSTPEVLYYTVAVAHALSIATSMGFGDYRELSNRAYQRVLKEQQQNGRFNYFSIKNYGFLVDARMYPRSLSMLCYHLLEESLDRQPKT
ncbi:MAG: hypothetical protein RLP44_08360 [Aggregatilineales bacterium]